MFDDSHHLRYSQVRAPTQGGRAFRAEAEAISEAFRDAQAEAELATKQDIAELRHEIELLRRDLKDLESRMTIRLGVMLVAAVGVVATLVKLL